MRVHRPVTWVRERPLVADSFFALALLATATTMAVLRWNTSLPDGFRSPDLLRLALLVPGLAPIALRRVRPGLALFVMVLALLPAQGLAFEDHGQSVGVLIGAYSLAAHGNPRAGRRLGAIYGAFLTAWIVIGLVADAPNADLGAVLVTNIVFGTAWILGDNVRRRREQVAALEERARQLEHERSLEDREARTRERAAIARELHDVVAHSVTVMVVQASGARRAVAKNPAAATAALEVIEETGRASLVELRRILGVLRDGESAELAPQPSVSRIVELASSDGELPVEVHITGEERELHPTVDVSAFRIVQEALTNVRKHAGPRAKASVDVDFGDRALTVRVSDNGRGAMTLVGERSGSGHGVVGMRERVAVCGGTLQSGPRIGGGWAVTATLPYEERLP